MPKEKSEMVTLHKFYFDAVTKAREYRWRYGQAFFNHLLEVRPQLAELVRGTDKDPFYLSTPCCDQFDRFAVFIEENWYK
jgi:hypothetical protein